MATKYHTTFGQVEVISEDETFVTVKLATGEEKKLMAKFANLTDEPVKKNKAKKIALNGINCTKEEKEKLALAQRARLAVGSDYVAYDDCSHLGKNNGFELLSNGRKEVYVRPSSMVYVNGFLAIPAKMFN